MEDIKERSEEEVVDNTDYITAIKELKQNSVEKAKYDSLKAENKKLLDAIVNGQEAHEAPQEEQIGARLDYYKDYKKNNFKTDLEYWDNLVKLRKATIKETGKDPCVTGQFGAKTPSGEIIRPSYGEEEMVKSQFDTIEKMLEEADGNAEYFEELLKSGLNRN